MSPNYSNTKIYMLYNNDRDISDIYIGYSTNIKDRMCVHRRCCNNPKNKSYTTRMYNFIRNNGGWEKWSYIIIEELNCSSKKEAEKKEEFWIKYYNPSLNTNKKIIKYNIK